MELYDEVDQETIMMLLSTLIRKTEDKSIWKNLDYSAICFIRGSRYDEVPGPEISQKFELEAYFNGTNYKLLISEKITLPSGKGDIYLAIDYTIGEDEKHYDLALSFDSKYAECSSESVKTMFADSQIVKLTDNIVALFEGTEVVENGFCGGYFVEKGIEPMWKKNDLVKLGERLKNEKRMVDFHKIILDTDYRNFITYLY